MFSIFKKKLKTDEAADIYLSALATIISRSWEDDVNEINDIFGSKVLDFEKFEPSFELYVAVVAMEFNAVMNLIPNKYNEILLSTLKLLGRDEDTGAYAIETINDEYLPSIRKSELDGAFPFEDLIFLLIQKLDIENSLFIDMVIKKILFSKTGTWKKIIETYKIV